MTSSETFLQIVFNLIKLIALKFPKTVLSSSSSEDDIMKELEELSLESTGGKGKVNASEGHLSSKIIFQSEIEDLF